MVLLLSQSPSVKMMGNAWSAMTGSKPHGSHWAISVDKLISPPPIEPLHSLVDLLFMFLIRAKLELS